MVVVDWVGLAIKCDAQVGRCRDAANYGAGLAPEVRLKRDNTVWSITTVIAADRDARAGAQMLHLESVYTQTYRT